MARLKISDLLMLLMFLALLLIPTAAITAWHLALSRMSRYTWRAYQVTGAIGAPLHELSHLAACLAFRLPVHHVAFYTPRSVDGSLGHVAFSANHHSIINNVGMAVQGIAPLIAGAAITGYVLQSPAPTQIPHELPRLFGWCIEICTRAIASILSLGTSGTVGLILAITLLAIAMHSIPSWADVRVGLKGLLLLGVTYIFGAAANEILSSYFDLTRHGYPAAVANWFTFGIQLCVAGSVQVVSLAIVGGLVLVVVPGWLLDLVVGGYLLFRRRFKASTDE